MGSEIKILHLGETDYPVRLLSLSNPPKALYCMGDISLLEKPCIALVGTRDSTRYGTQVATEFSKQFAEAGYIVISGLAAGIDTIAHLGAISDNNVKTIAVLGNGFNHYYPAVNRDLQDKIGMHGLLISEYEPDARGAVYTYPARNRIVAALSSAIVVVEADVKSGTMITKNHAKKLGIPVFAVPGNISSDKSNGTNALIQSGDARPAISPFDVLKYLDSNAKPIKAISKKEKVQLSMQETLILKILNTDTVHMDEIMEKINLPIEELSTQITNMEIRGLIERLPGNMFVAK